MASAFTLFGEIRVDTGNTARALRDVERELKSSEKRIKSTEDAYDSLGKKTATVTNRLDKFKDKNKEISRNLKEVTEKFNRGEITAKQYEAALRSLARQTNSVSNQTKTASASVQTMGDRMEDAAKKSRSLASIGESVKNLGSTLQNVGIGLTASITLPVAALGKSILTAGADYEKALNVFQAVTSATAKEMATAADTAKQLGADVTLPATSALDAAKAMTELGKAGFTAGQAMEATRGVLLLSAAGQIEEARAAEIAANALNAFKLKASETATVANLLAAASNASSAEVEDLAQSFQQSSAVFAGAKIPIQDLTTAISLMSNAGIKGSDAGTALKTFVTKLTAPTASAAKSMESLGVNVFDTAGKMKALPDIIGQFNKSLSKLNDGQKAQTLYDIFGSDALRAAQVLFAEGEKGFEKMREAVTKVGSASDLAISKTKGVGGAWDAVSSQLETIGIDVFNAIKTPLTNVLKTTATVVEGISNAFNKLPQSTQQAIVGITAVGAALGPVVLILGSLVSAVGAVATGIASVGFMPLVAGAVAVAAALGTVTAAAVVFAKGWQDNFGGIADFTKEIADKVKTYWDAGLKELKTLNGEQLKQITDFWKKNGEDIEKAVENTITMLKTFWKEYGEDIKTIVSASWNVIKTVIKEGTTAILGIVKTFAAVINGDWSKVWDGMKTVLGAFWEYVKANARASGQVLVSIIGGLAKMVYNLGKQFYDAAYNIGFQIGEGIKKGIADKYAEVKNSAYNLGLAAVMAAKGALGIYSPSKVFMSLGEDVVAGLVLGLEKSKNKATTSITTLAQSLVAAFESLGIIKPKIQSFTKDLTELFSNKSLSGFIKSLADQTGLSVEAFKSQSLAMAAAKDKANALKTSYEANLKVLEKMTEKVQFLNGSFFDTSIFQGVMPSRGIGPGISDIFSNGSPTGAEDFIAPPPEMQTVGKWQQIFNAIKENYNQFGDSMITRSQAIGNGITSMLDEVGYIFSSSIQNFDGTLSGFFKSIASGFADMVKRIIAELTALIAVATTAGILTAIFGGGFGSGWNMVMNSQQGSGGFGGMFAGIFGGGSGSGGSAAGHKQGGFTANVPTNKIAGVVHGREFVLKAQAVKALVSNFGSGFLHSLNNYKGFMQGGFTSPTPAYAGSGGSISPSATSSHSSNINIVMNVNGVNDANSFKYSENQIVDRLAAKVQQKLLKKSF